MNKKVVLSVLGLGLGCNLAEIRNWPEVKDLESNKKRENKKRKKAAREAKMRAKRLDKLRKKERNNHEH